MTQVMQMPVGSGVPAPDVAVPAVQENRLISLADYRGSTPLLLGLFPGLYCPFCRRALAQMAATSEKLKPLGVESLAVVWTELENARLYFRFRPTPLALGADPQLTTHRSYGVPRPEPTPELVVMIERVRINPTGEFPEPLPIPVAFKALNNLDGFQPTATDQREANRPLRRRKDSSSLIAGVLSDGQTSNVAKRVFPALESFRRTTSCWPLRASLLIETLGARNANHGSPTFVSGRI